MIATFLQELDQCARESEVDEHGAGVYVLATAGSLAAIDPRVLRSGRLDQVSYFHLL